VCATIETACQDFANNGAHCCRRGQGCLLPIICLSAAFLLACLPVDLLLSRFLRSGLMHALLCQCLCLTQRLRRARRLPLDLWRAVLLQGGNEVPRVQAGVVRAKTVPLCGVKGMARDLCSRLYLCMSGVGGGSPLRAHDSLWASDFLVM